MMADPPPSASPSSSSAAESLCFGAASHHYRNQRISWEEYLRHCPLHYVDGPPLHAGDALEWRASRFREPDLKAHDPVAYLLWYSQRQTYGVKDVCELEAVFRAYRNGSLKDLKTRLDALPVELAKTMRRALAHLALQDRRLDVLEYVLNDGQIRYDPPITSSFEDKVAMIDRASEPELADIIARSTWASPWHQFQNAGPGHGLAWNAAAAFADLW